MKELRIDSFGPSTTQPLAVSRRLPRRLRTEILAAVLELNDDGQARRCFAHTANPSRSQ